MLDQRRELIQTRCTIDGHPASVGGVRNEFATVTDLVTGASYEWAWATVFNVVTFNNGAFRS